MTIRNIKSRNVWLTSLFIFVAMVFFVNTTTIAKELPDFTEMVEKNGPAVVNVSTKTRGKQRNLRKRQKPQTPAGESHNNRQVSRKSPR